MISENKLSWQQMKEEQAKKRKREAELKKVEARIEELETRDSEIDETMVLPDVCTNVAECTKLSREKQPSLKNWKSFMKNGRAGPTVSSFLSPYVFMEAACLDAVQSIHHRYGLFLLLHRIPDRCRDKIHGQLCTGFHGISFYQPCTEHGCKKISCPGIASAGFLCKYPGACFRFPGQDFPFSEAGPSSL